MEPSLKELLEMLKCCKKALKMINRMYKWKYIPLERPLKEKQQLEEHISRLEIQIKRAKERLKKKCK